MSRIRADRYTNREGTGAPTFSEGVNVVGVTSMSGDLAVTNGTITGPSQLTISGITSSISDTAVDVFVYDTSKDSDGGAWRKRTQNTSWYNETLNTATRGSRKDFPAVAVIVVDSTFDLTIYDGDDPDLPMWMKFENSGFLSWSTSGDCEIKTVSMLNGIFVTGGDDGDGGIYVNFVSDHVRTIFGNGNKYDMTGATPIISNRSATVSFLNNSAGDGIVIINSNINDVAMTVLPTAPIDPDTGLPVPTIAVATAGGVSVIKDDGNIGNITFLTYATDQVSFDSNNGLWLSYLASSSAIGWYYYTSFETTTSLPATGPNCNNGWSGSFNMTGDSNFTGIARNYPNFSAGTVDKLHNFHGFGIVDASTKLVNYISSSYNTGWMQGDIKLTTLSDTDATNQTGGTVADRSVNNNSLNVTGTITKTAVATGAELVAYSGFSASNYLEQPYNSDLAPGTGVYSVVAWFKTGPTAADQYIFDRSSDGSPRALMLIRASNGGNPNTIQFYHQNAAGTNTDLTTSDITVTDDVWHHVVGLFDGSVYRVYIDGRASTITGSPVRDIDNTDSPVLKVGIRYSNTAPMTGNIALFRWSKSAPSAEQVNKMYNDEKFLFQENSQATLYGSSDTVTALGYDGTTDLLHVGTSAGRSDFQGLMRINNTTVGITTAISASNELVAEQ